MQTHKRIKTHLEKWQIIAAEESSNSSKISFKKARLHCWENDFNQSDLIKDKNIWLRKNPRGVANIILFLL